MPDFSSLKQLAGSVIGGATGSIKASSSDDPALNKVVKDDLMRKIQVIKEDNWNKVFPYFFALGDASGNNGAVAGFSDVGNSEIFGDVFKSNKMPLLIPPSAISIATQHAVNVTATNHGILEEHNGTVFRTIQISGTTGVLPLKTNRGQQGGGLLNDLKRIGNSIAPATTAAISGFASQITKTVNAVTGGGNNEINGINDQLNQDNKAKLLKSGYYQFWLLHNFIVAYTEIKKKVEARDVRLMFISPKDNIGYVVTPMGFELKRDAGNPLLYRYNITLKAWDLMPANIEAKPQDIDIPRPAAVGVIASIANLITQGRKTITAASNILSGVNSDIQSVGDLLNQTEIFFKELGGLAYSVGNFKPTFFNNRNTILLSSPNNRVQMQNAIKSDGIAGASNIAGNINNFVVQSNKASASTLSRLSAAGSSVNYSKTSKFTPSGEDKVVAMTNQITNQADSAVQIALSLESFNDLTLDQLDIPVSVQKEIKSKIAETSSLTGGDIRELSDKLGEVNDNFAISINAMDADYAAIYNVPFANTISTKIPTEDEILISVAIQETRQALTSTLATGEIFQERDPNPYTSANLAIPSEDKMAVASGALAVPWQRGATIETLAIQYLGDSKRAREIEVLNGMRAPYIDEVGFNLSISGANGRTFVVTTNANLAINQEIVLKGTSVANSRRLIVNIQDIGNNKSRIMVDGPANLDMYEPSTNPFINARIPGTIGPGDMILIPSNQAPPDLIPERPTPLLTSLTHAEKIFKIDVALSADGTDFDVGADGDAKRSYGYNNAVQAIRLAVETEKNELERHLGYGLPVSIGARTVDTDIDDFQDAVSSTITTDPRFITADVNATIEGNVVRVGVTAFGASQTGQIPVNFDIQRN